MQGHSTDENTGLINGLQTWYDQQSSKHPETGFVLKASLLVFLIMTAKSFVEANDFFQVILLMFLLFMPLYFVIFCMHRWRSKNVGFFRNLYEFIRENVTIVSVPTVEHQEAFKNSAWVTYSLILVNEIIFYFVQPAFPKIFHHLAFIPWSHEWLDLTCALFSSMFLHIDDMHLWGNMMFLWGVGTVVERRIGWRLFIGGYLVSGMVASLLAVNIHYYLLGEEMHGIGASGAISGVMGMYMIRCYFKQMVFPIPFLGVLPISWKMRMNSMTFIGLFFALDLKEGYSQISGENFSMIAHWAHVGGMYAGMMIAATRRFEKDADLEFNEERGMSAIRNGTLSSAGFDKLIGLDAAEVSLRKVLASQPDNVSAMLQLARTRSHLVADREAKELYAGVIAKLVVSDTAEAMNVYLEYYKKYMDIVSPAVQYRLVPHFLKAGQYEIASRSLELIIAHDDTPPDIKEKAMYNCARVFDEMDLPEAANLMRINYLNLFPDSISSAKVRSALNLETND
ncbi:MAG: rhomboid family intramembrane serine protease [Desulfuromonadaceae bacterium]|nr:rhomboid family intramembrane serine protease [Desulfuromonadaceae bacterium]MDD2856267.1 rhomboid family intramembrane serine protease [Desulfuromonadaceae bacterium]